MHAATPALRRTLIRRGACPEPDEGRHLLPEGEGQRRKPLSLRERGRAEGTAELAGRYVRRPLRYGLFCSAQSAGRCTQRRPRFAVPSSGAEPVLSLTKGATFSRREKGSVVSPSASGRGVGVRVRRS